MHLAAVFNASSGLASIYWDGRLRAEGPMPTPLQYQRPEAFVGRSTQVGASLTGLVDEVRLWSVARSRTDLLAGVFKTLTGPIGGLLFSLPLNEVRTPLLGSCLSVRTRLCGLPGQIRSRERPLSLGRFELIRRREWTVRTQPSVTSAGEMQR